MQRIKHSHSIHTQTCNLTRCFPSTLSQDRGRRDLISAGKFMHANTCFFVAHHDQMARKRWKPVRNKVHSNTLSTKQEGMLHDFPISDHEHLHEAWGNGNRFDKESLWCFSDSFHVHVSREKNYSSHPIVTQWSIKLEVFTYISLWEIESHMKLRKKEITQVIIVVNQNLKYSHECLSEKSSLTWSWEKISNCNIVVNQSWSIHISLWEIESLSLTWSCVSNSCLRLL